MRFLPYFQMGSNVVWQTMPFLGGCARALSWIRQPHMVPTPEIMPYDLPLWHSVLFRNEHQQSYFCPRLIRDGVLTWGGFLEDDTSQALIAPSYGSIYNVPKPQCHDGDPNLLNLDLWSFWTKSGVGARMSYPIHIKNRQPPEVWIKFCTSRIPLNLNDFIWKAPWKKLPVGARLSKWIPTALHCPLDGVVETIDHALSTCRSLPVAFSTISKCFLPLSIDGVTVSSVQDLMSSYLDTTFEVPAGIMSG